MPRGLVLDYAGVLTEPDAGELLAAVAVLRARGVRTALLSNAPGAAPAARRELGAHFDALVFSGEVGVAKPAAEVYRIAAERLALPVDACVFVDDSRRNVDGAVAAGMTGVWHTGVPATLDELDALFPSG
ncbi:haloacid dehalogenase [Amycolatopsis antarctica]|uniref:Haloacid dehalogenase n=1 Tax=Amycolatopsis antarctica TaxID=1854586 RepID=A0A263D8T7_9PSEU|nr:haloacid dehalogenase [Amycolatopsis antarctica]